MIELKLVYRFLRKVSDWTTESYYSDVQVIGSSNIPKDHPIILASTHHNEMIDIATLAATIPHRRFLSFWAKSSMFANPITNFIMSSVGAIPVKRNPNNVKEKEPQTLLFQSTSETLAKDGIVVVFVEGTSYTQPKIIQVLSGAGWAAVEFLKYQKRRKEGKELLVIPVGIVYTDKSKYMSRIRIEYGQPIPLDESPTTHHITNTIHSSLLQLTINAPDWDTFYCVFIARQILWGDEDKIPLKEWVKVGGVLVELLTDVETKLKSSLIAYFSLLYYAGIEHRTLEGMVSSSSPSLIKPLITSLIGITPILPTLPIYIPAYISSHLITALLATKGEEEGVAQFMGVGGGIGRVLGGLGGFWWVLNRSGLVSKFPTFISDLFSSLSLSLSLSPSNPLSSLEKLFSNSNLNPLLGKFLSKSNPLLTLAALLIIDSLIVSWYRLWIPSVYKKIKVLYAVGRVVFGSIFSRRGVSRHMGNGQVGLEKLTSKSESKYGPFEKYTLPPPPPQNAFIRRRLEKERQKAESTSMSKALTVSESEALTESLSESASGSLTLSKSKTEAELEVNPPLPPPVPLYTLLSTLLYAREEARTQLGGYLRSRLKGNQNEKEKVEWLREVGAKI